MEVTPRVAHVTRAVIGAALISLCAPGASAAQEPSERRGALAEPAGAGSSPVARRSIGVSFGVSDPHWHRESGPAGADTAISLDLPLHETVALKIELGTVTWTFSTLRPTFDGQLRQELRSDDFTATRLTLSYVGQTSPTNRVTILWRAGGGYYHFSSGTSDLNRHSRLGAHGGAGIEVPLGGRFSVGGRALYHVIPGRPINLSGAPLSFHTLSVVSAAVDWRVHF